MHQSLTSSSLKKRVRLAPAVRKQLILDSALAEFSAQGFGAASTEKIAQRAGLSQAGLYAHFKSKEDILCALFNQILVPLWPQRLTIDEPLSEQKIDSLVDDWYAKAGEARFLSIFRVLVAEGVRLPHLVREWHQRVVLPFLAEQQRVLDALILQGHVQRNVLSEYFPLAAAPLIHAMVLSLLTGGVEGGIAEEIKQMREAHRKMLKHYLLATPSPVAAEPDPKDQKPTSLRARHTRHSSDCD